MTEENDVRQENHSTLDRLGELLCEERRLATVESALHAANTSSVRNEFSAKREQRIIAERQVLIRRIRAIEAELGRLGR
jgi:hypothetical protein